MPNSNNEKWCSSSFISNNNNDKNKTRCHMSLRAVTSAIVATIVVLVGAACLGVSLGIAIDSIETVGEHWARDISRSLTTVVHHYFGTWQAEMSSATTLAKAHNASIPEDDMDLGKPNLTATVWRNYLVAFDARHSSVGRMAFDVAGISFFRRTWMYMGYSRADPSNNVRTMEWIEDLWNNASSLSVGGFRWNKSAMALVPYDPTYCNGGMEIFCSFAPSLQTEQASSIRLLKAVRQLFPGIPPCFVTAPVFNPDVARGSFWNMWIACGVLNRSDTLIGRSFVGFDPVRDMRPQLLAAPRSATGHSFVLAAWPDARVYVATTPEPVFHSYVSPTLKKTDTLPAGCSSSLLQFPLLAPPVVGCLRTLANYSYPPLQAIPNSLAVNPSYDFGLFTASDDQNYFVSSQRLALSMRMAIPLNLVSVIPEADLLLDKVKKSVALSVGLTVLVAVGACVVAWAVLHYVTRRLEAVQQKMIAVATLQNLEGEDDIVNDSTTAMDDDDDDNIVIESSNLDENNEDDNLKGKMSESPTAVLQSFEQFGKQKNGVFEVNNNKNNNNNNQGKTKRRKRPNLHPSGKKTPTTKNTGASGDFSDSEGECNQNVEDRSWIAEVAHLEDAYAETVRSMTNFTRYVSRAVVKELILQREKQMTRATIEQEFDLEPASANILMSPQQKQLKNDNDDDSVENKCAISPRQKQHMAGSDSVRVSASAAMEYEVTLLSADIEGFSSQIWATNPENHDGVLYILHIYFKRMCRLIMGHGGVVDKFLGDSIMSYWGAPVRTEHHALLATLAALSLVRESRRDPLKKIFAQTLKREVKLRCGLSSGTAIVGAFGSSESVNYTVVGTPVKQSINLQEFNKYWHTTILMDGPCMRKVGEVVVNRLLCQAKFQLDGRIVDVYEVMGLNPEAPLCLRDATGSLRENSKTIAFTDILSLPTVRTSGDGVEEMLAASAPEHDSQLMALLNWHLKGRSCLPRAYVAFAERFSDAVRAFIDLRFDAAVKLFDEIDYAVFSASRSASTTSGASTSWIVARRGAASNSAVAVAANAATPDMATTSSVCGKVNQDDMEESNNNENNNNINNQNETTRQSQVQQKAVQERMHKYEKSPLIFQLSTREKDEVAAALISIAKHFLEHDVSPSSIHRATNTYFVRAFQLPTYHQQEQQQSFLQ